MGRVFLTVLSGSRLVICAKCQAPLTTKEELQSKSFVCSSGTAYLFRRVVNISVSAVHERTMTTGRHFVRDVACKRCAARLGWMYEYAVEEGQRYKEGQVILERKLFREVDNKVDYQEQEEDGALGPL